MSWNPTRPNNTRAARTMRERVLREQPTCAAPDCGRPSTHDDHIVGWSQLEAHDMTVQQWHARSNHQGLCAEHHDAKTADERAAGRRVARRRDTRRTPEPHPGAL